MATFNTAEELRSILTENPSLDQPGIVKELRRRHPRCRINENSLSATLSQQRKRLGVTAPKFADGKPSSSTYSLTVQVPPGEWTADAVDRFNGPVNLDILKGAARLIREIGDAETASEAIRQVQQLQVG